MKRIFLFVVAALAMVSCGSEEQEPKIISLYFDDELLIDAKAAVAAEDPAIMEYYTALKEQTDAAYLNMAPLSIVDDKIHVAPSRDPRDYISLSPYWWPDPEVEGGVPYVRNDGVRNPEVYEYHERRRGELFNVSIQSLATMYYLSGEEKYAEKAAEMIRYWFLDPVKGMNPNMTYAQYVPGMEKIRGTGIIDSRRFLTGLNAAQMIKGSEAWTAEDEFKLKRWAAAFAYWLENSINGLTEFKAENNHGLWYEVAHQISVMYSGDYDYLRKIIVDQQLPRFGRQVAEDGTLPHELERTLGLHYTTFALEAVNLSAIMGAKVGVDVWGHVAENGRSMKMAVDYAVPYYQEPETWPHMQINPFNQGRGATILYHAGKALGNQEYTDLAFELGRTPANGDGEHKGGFYDVLYYKLNK
ncbi:MAG: alginate lyase family protein [Rikenellaceae bacterium]